MLNSAYLESSTKHVSRYRPPYNLTSHWSINDNTVPFVTAAAVSEGPLSRVLLALYWYTHRSFVLFNGQPYHAYHAYSVVFAKGIKGLCEDRPSRTSSRWWSQCSLTFRHRHCRYAGHWSPFRYTASVLGARLRMVSFKALLRQDIDFLTRIRTMSVVASFCSEIGYSRIVGVHRHDLCLTHREPAESQWTCGYYAWSHCVEYCHTCSWFRSWVGLVGVACIPLLVSPGYIRLVRWVVGSAEFVLLMIFTSV